MKCLGALDSFVVKLFLIESTMQGFLGTLIGVVLGLALASLKVLYDYGWLSVGFIPWSQLGFSVLFSLVCGTSLAVGGALYPAYVAAKMEPAVAMRVDQ
jgi:ABC-type lipoprotein release transport system permease subunit